MGRSIRAELLIMDPVDGKLTGLIDQPKVIEDYESILAIMKQLTITTIAGTRDCYLACNLE